MTFWCPGCMVYRGESEVDRTGCGVWECVWCGHALNSPEYDEGVDFRWWRIFQA